MDIHTLQALLRKEIPLSQAMQVKVIKLDEALCEIEVPLEPNINHKGTVFGGSLYAACTLASYGLFLNGLRARGLETNNIVIAKGEIIYLTPVHQDFRIRAEWPSNEAKSQFFKTLLTKGKAKTTLTAKIATDASVSAQFTGRFVAFK